MKKTITAFVAASVLPLVALCQNYKIGDTIRTDDEILVIRDFRDFYIYSSDDTEAMFIANTEFPTYMESLLDPSGSDRRERRETNWILATSSRPYEEVYQAVRNVFSKEEAENIWFRFAVTADFNGKIDNVGIAISDREPGNAVPIQKWLQLRKELMNVTLAIPENAHLIYKRIWAVSGVNGKRVYEKMPE